MDNREILLKKTLNSVLNIAPDGKDLTCMCLMLVEMSKHRWDPRYSKTYMLNLNKWAECLVLSLSIYL
jgi:hypothetical protein